MRRLERLAAKTYGRHLRETESVCVATDATAAGTGRWVAAGTVLGALAGLLYTILIEGTPPAAAAVAGGFAGVIAGYLFAARKARGEAGPGATQVRLVLTEQRLLFFRPHAAIRFRPLRIISIDDVTGISSRRSLAGPYQTVTIDLRDEPPLRIYVRAAEKLLSALREHTIPEAVD